MSSSEDDINAVRALDKRMEMASAMAPKRAPLPRLSPGSLSSLGSAVGGAASSGALLGNTVNDALRRMHTNVESLEGQLQELRSNFNPEVLVECLTAVTDENRQLREENNQLREQVLAEQAKGAALAERFASLAERVSHVVLDKLIGGG